MRIARKLEAVEIESDRVVLATDAVAISIQALTTDVLRIRTAFDSFAEGSYTLVRTAWDDPFDVVLGAERERIAALPLQVEEETHVVRITAGHIRCEVDREPFRLRVFNQQDECVHADVVELGYRQDSNGRRIHTSEINPDDCFYGFGEKTGNLNKAGEFLTMSPKDALGYDPRRTDSLYKHMPVYLKLNRHTRTATGYFYHNTWECDFTMGRERSNYWPRYSRYRCDGGEIDLFLILGPSIREVVQRFTYLVGTSALLPRHAYGYLGSSMYYAELPANCDSAIEHFADTCAAEGIELTGFQLSSGYTQYHTDEGLRRCVFTWNKERFPDPAAFLRAMGERSIVVSPNVKPGVLVSHPDAAQWAQAGLFIKAAQSDAPAVGRWWGGPGYFTDFTNPQARALWSELLRHNVLEMGTASVWNDNCEYDSLVDLDARCDGDGGGGTVGQWKSVMANLMCRETVAAIARTHPRARPFVVCRAGHVGIQRYAQSWAGDNFTSWETLERNITTILGMGLCGVANYGADIGGFAGPAPDPELLVRWVQNGIFQPRFSIHSVNSDNTVTEPWMYPEVTDLVKAAMDWRTRMFPYLYSLAARAHRTGQPIWEPLCSAFQHDAACDDEDVTFVFGHLLVANVVRPKATTRQVYFPTGQAFYDLQSRARYEGGSTHHLAVELSSIPVFLPEDGIYLEAEDTTLRVVCAPAGEGSFTLYQDDGWSTDFEDGAWRTTTIRTTGGRHTCVEFTQEGDYPDEFEQIQLEVIHPDCAPLSITADGKTIPRYLYQPDFSQAASGWYYSLSTSTAVIKYPNPGSDHRVDISFDQANLLGM